MRDYSEFLRLNGFAVKSSFSTYAFNGVFGIVYNKTDIYKQPFVAIHTKYVACKKIMQNIAKKLHKALSNYEVKIKFKVVDNCMFIEALSEDKKCDLEELKRELAKAYEDTIKSSLVKKEKN